MSPASSTGGVSAGQSRAKIAEEGVAASALGGAAVTGVSSDKRDNGYKLFGGYQLNRNIGIEAGYFSLGKFSFSGNAPANAFNAGGPFNAEARIRGFNLDLVGTLPVTENLSVIGRIGAQVARTRDNFSGAGAAGIANTSPSKRDTNYKVGAGLQYEVNRSFWGARRSRALPHQGRRGWNGQRQPVLRGPGVPVWPCTAGGTPR